MAEGSGALELGVGPGLGPKRQPFVWCQTKLQLHQCGRGAGHGRAGAKDAVLRKPKLFCSRLLSPGSPLKARAHRKSCGGQWTEAWLKIP